MIKTTHGVKQIVAEEGVYDRLAVTTPGIINKCNGCGDKHVPGICMDNSGGEYTPAHVCFECIDLIKQSINPV